MKRTQNARTLAVGEIYQMAQRLNFKQFCDEMWKKRPDMARKMGLADPQRREQLRRAYELVRGQDRENLQQMTDDLSASIAKARMT